MFGGGSGGGGRDLHGVWSREGDDAVAGDSSANSHRLLSL